MRTIDLFAKYYDSDQFMVGFFDAITMDPAGLLEAVQKHVGCQTVVLPEDTAKLVNSSKKTDLPPEFNAYLKELYRDDIDELAKRYGSYARLWQMEMDGESVDPVDEADCLKPVVHP